MSTHKQGGKAAQHVRPAGKRLGVKVTENTKIGPGEIIIRQRGTVFAAGNGVKVGRDHSLYAAKAGVVKYGIKMGKKFVSVI